ncbi:FkbM family methyltransferase [Natrinema salinisoli]|uniref:FkbM family methyltransferase n=1 Tax=Natrinema salinisoli TaxID=2878535 RepID=UPI001CF0A313|nr:FkbM family methyltransferase [Natrinema salinisoli]
MKIDLQNAEISPLIQLEIARGRYEADEADAIDAYITPEQDVIELGGCVGFTACYTNQKLAPDSTHIVVEPNKHLIPILERNRDLNNCDFQVIHAAYSPTREPVSLTVPDEEWSGSLHQTEGSTQTVDSLSFSSLISEFDLSNVMLLVDIEGSEYDLISQELAALEAHCDVLLIEFHDQRREFKDLADKIRSARNTLASSSFMCVEEMSDVAVYRGN